MSAALDGEPVPCFVLLMHPDGKLSWKTSLPMPQLNLALDGIKADILAGRIEQSRLIKPTNGLDGIRQKAGL